MDNIIPPLYILEGEYRLTIDPIQSKKNRLTTYVLEKKVYDDYRPSEISLISILNINYYNQTDERNSLN